MFRFESLGKTQPAEAEKRLESVAEKEKFSGYLEEIVEKLNGSNLDWRVVGSFGLESVCAKDSDHRRNNGTVRDFDVMVLNDPPREREKLKKYFDGRMTEVNRSSEPEAVWPEVSLGTLMTPEKYSERNKKMLKTPQLLSHLMREGDDFFLQFKEIKEKIDPEVLKAVEAKVKVGGNEVAVKTFHPQTLLHLYLGRVGYIKPKDMEKIKNFVREEKIKDYETVSHELYLPFHRFAKEMRKRYKITTRALQLYNYIDHRYFQSAISHKLIPKEIMDILLAT